MSRVGTVGRDLVKGGTGLWCSPLTRERCFIAHVFFISYFEGYSYLCLLLIPGQLGERIYNPAVIWLVFFKSIFKL